VSGGVALSILIARPGQSIVLSRKIDPNARLVPGGKAITGLGNGGVNEENDPDHQNRRGPKPKVIFQIKILPQRRNPANCFRQAPKF
jgi:hypothetical protein